MGRSQHPQNNQSAGGPGESQGKGGKTPGAAQQGTPGVRGVTPRDVAHLADPALANKPLFDDCVNVGGVRAEGGSSSRKGGPAKNTEWDGVDRRAPGPDRRTRQAMERAEKGEGDLDVFDAQTLERRRGPGRRLSDFQRAAEEGQLTNEQFLFVMAIETFKRANGVTFPSWTDVLEVVRLLGYRKTMPMEIKVTAAEDWRETPEAPSNVRAPRWAEHTQRERRGGDRNAA